MGNLRVSFVMRFGGGGNLSLIRLVRYDITHSRSEVARLLGMRMRMGVGGGKLSLILIVVGGGGRRKIIRMGC